MRVSTSQVYTNLNSYTAKLTSEISQAQRNISSGLRVHQAADDVLAYNQASNSGNLISMLDNFNKTSNLIASKMQTGETIASTMNSTMQNVKLNINRAGSTLNTGDLQTIVLDISKQKEEIVNLMNSQDENGHYIFSGTKAGTQTVSNNQFQGNNQKIQAYINNENLVDTNMDLSGLFQIRNSYNADITMTTANRVSDFKVESKSGAYSLTTDSSIRFTSSTSYDIYDSSNNLVSAGNTLSGTSISYSGLTLNIAGAPSTGDRIDIKFEQSQNYLQKLDNLMTTIGNKNTMSDGEYATKMMEFNQVFNASELYMTNEIAKSGAIQSQIETITQQNTDVSLILKEKVSDLTEADIVAEYSNLSQRQQQLEAVLKSFKVNQGLSLFSMI